MTRAAVFAGLGGLLLGHDTGVIGGALPLIVEDFDWDTPFREGVITLSLLPGGAPRRRPSRAAAAVGPAG
ncbi:hypothetical protein [Frankia sp. AiPa1]|uniref:hypothetical protein n=1 Tax=Frankia sp. AiPa1 TaxID=573492 RepID=UPI00202AF860|nr:hypothetical protein [Frankia sp. AiPa1]MCL9760903.1 hypothetical protein [Frankia sp. AiPa1]